MSNFTLAATRPVLADRLGTKSIVTDIAYIAAGAALTAGAAQIVIPMWPVPITGQTFAVLLVGTSLGALRGSLSMLLYLALGAFGLPVFAESASGIEKITGPTGGYLIGFIFAAALTGWMAQMQWDRRVSKTILSFILGSAAIYAIGLPWLSSYLGAVGAPNDLTATLQAGLYPFIPGDILKAVVAGGLFPFVWKIINRSQKKL